MEKEQLIISVSKSNSDKLHAYCNDTGNNRDKLIDYLIFQFVKQLEAKFGRE